MRASQTVLPFKLAASDESLTAHAGLVLFDEYMRAMGIAGLINHELPGAGSVAGYDPSAHVSPLVLMLAGGKNWSLRQTRGGSIRSDRDGFRTRPAAHEVTPHVPRGVFSRGTTSRPACWRYACRPARYRSCARGPRPIAPAAPAAPAMRRKGRRHRRAHAGKLLAV